MATYKLYKKTSDTAKEEIQIPASSVSGLANVATSGSYNDLIDKPKVPGVPDVVQTTGQSTTAVMSQKAVTDEFTNYVTTTTNQGIFGKKWFINGEGASIVSQSQNIDLNNKPTTSSQWNFIDFTDKTNTRLGVVGSIISPDGYAGTYLQARNAAGIGIKANANGEVYTWAHTPDDNNNSNQIATTEWVVRKTPFDSNGLSTGTLGSTKLPSAGRYYIEKKASMSQNIISFVLDFNNAATSSSYAYLSAAGDNALGEVWLFVYVSGNGTVTMSEYSPKTNGEISFDKDETGTFKYKKLN